MVEVRGFADLEEALAQMRRAEDAANARLTPLQLAVTWGSRWWSFRPDHDDLLIFGECWTMLKIEASERGAGADTEEWLWTRNRLLDSHDRGWRFGMAYSVIVPEGEIGSTHISQMLSPLGEKQWRNAKDRNWYISPWCLTGLKTGDGFNHSMCPIGCACPCHAERIGS